MCVYHHQKSDRSKIKQQKNKMAAMKNIKTELNEISFLYKLGSPQA